MKAIVLFSGGQDSTTCLCYAIHEHGADHVLALSVDYGQRHSPELDAARAIARQLGVQHEVIDTSVLKQLGGSALVSDSTLSGTGGFGDAEAPGGLPTSFVPGRNMLFLAFASAVAVKHGARLIYTGVCQTDYSGYPDCRADFIKSMNKTIDFAMPSECGPFEIRTPLMFLTKAETVRLARELGDSCWQALALSLTCYNGERPGCGTCPACELRAKGFELAGELDPAESVG